MENLLTDFIDAISTDKHTLIKLKELAVSSKQYEFAKKIRDIEHKQFPETKATIKIKERYENLSNAVKMLGISTNPKTIYVIDKVIKSFNKKGTQFSIKDKVSIEIKADKIF